MKALIDYHKQSYIKSSKMVIPLMFWIAILIFLYWGKSESLLGNVEICIGVLFLLMTIIGFSFMDMEDVVSDQVMIINVGSMNRYNFSKDLFLILLNVYMSVLGLAFPILRYMGSGGTVFQEKIRLIDCIWSLLALLVAAFMGEMLGAFMHPRIMKRRAFCLELLVCLVVLCFVKGPVIEEFSIMKYFLWVLPPVYNLLNSMGHIESTSVVTMIVTLLYGLGYGISLLALQIFILSKNKY